VIALLAWIVLRQRPSARLAVGIALGVAGLLLISSTSLTGWDDGSDLAGDLLLLLATVFAASYVIVSSRFVADIPPATLAASQQLVGLLLAVGILGVAELTRLQHQDWAAVSGGDLAYAAGSGIVQYALAFWLYLIGLKHLKPSAAGLWLALTPVFGILGGVLWLGEVPSPIMIVGGLVVIAGLAVGRPTGEVE
jgi:drug/metabolite transporter (DMT)-like permease